MEIRRLRDSVVPLTAVLSVVSLALVFGAVGQVIPAELLPDLGDDVIAAIPHANAAISLTAIVVIGQGWRWVRRGEIRKHRLAMGAGVALFASFLLLYLYRLTLRGTTTFPGEGAVAILYYVILAVHILLAIVCIPLLYYVLLLAITRPVSEIPLSDHPRIGRIAAALWLTSFALGVVVYLLLYQVY